MPRRVVTKCRRVGDIETIDQTVEMNLAWGHAFGPWDIHTRAEFARGWRRWGDEITRRWIGAFPGSRPMAVYLLGLVVPPDHVHELPGLRRPMRPIDGVENPIADTSWHKLHPEFDHLVALGLVDRKERTAAIERLDSAWPTDPRRYRSLYDETPERWSPRRRVVDDGDSPG
jgi:hypothetical protein